MTDSAAKVVIELSKLKYRWPKSPIDTLAIPALQVHQGQHLFIQGASGSGKSTLLNILSGVLSAQSGKVNILNTDLQTLSQAQKDRFRAEHMGIVFQQFNLLPYLTAYENIALALKVSKKSPLPQNSGDPILSLLAELGLTATVAKQAANTLSIGQQQRVAVARALITQPAILIVDEPTSALDSDSRDQFMQQLFKVAEDANSTIIFVSHDEALKTHFKQHIQLADINQANNNSKNTTL